MFFSTNSHKNVQVRKTTSYFVVEVVEKMGPGRILSGVKDVTDRVLPTAAHFAMDSSQETRSAKLFEFFVLQFIDLDCVLI